MEYKRALAIKGAVYSAAIITLGLTACQLIFGHTPSMSRILIMDSWSVKLPFSVSAWWYVFMGPLYSMVLMKFFQSQLVTGNQRYGLLKKWTMNKTLIFAFVLTFLLGVYGGLLPCVIAITIAVVLGRPRLSNNVISNRLSLTMATSATIGVLLAMGLVFGPLFVLLAAYFYLNHIFFKKAAEWEEYIFTHI